MSKIKRMEVIRSVYWVEVPEAGLYMLCGCPEDAVKHLMQRRLIVPTEQDGVRFETGPNAILLSDVALQNGKFCNLAEFPVIPTTKARNHFSLDPRNRFLPRWSTASSTMRSSKRWAQKRCSESSIFSTERRFRTRSVPRSPVKFTKFPARRSSVSRLSFGNC